MIPVAICSFIYPAFGAIIIPLLILMNCRNRYTRTMKWLFIAMTFVMATLGYSMGEWGDLERYHQQLLYLEKTDLFTIIQFDSEYLYTADLLLYFVSQTENVRILNFIIGFIVYGIVFYVLNDILSRSSENFGIGTMVKFAVIVVGIVPFLILLQMYVV